MAEGSFLIKVAPYATVVALIIGVEDLASSSSPEAPAPAPPACVPNLAFVPETQEDRLALHPCLTTPEERRRTFTFALGDRATHRALFLQSVAELRPEARRLVDVVDGLVTVRLNLAHLGLYGLAAARPRGRFEIRIATRHVLARSGKLGVKHVIAHELGHVIDRVMLSRVTKPFFESLIPRGFRCRRKFHPDGCSRRAERFAATFARWATGDPRAPSSYRVPLPIVPLGVWAMPLTHLAGQVGPPP